MEGWSRPEVLPGLRKPDVDTFASHTAHELPGGVVVIKSAHAARRAAAAARVPETKIFGRDDCQLGPDVPEDEAQVLADQSKALLRSQGLTGTYGHPHREAAPRSHQLHALGDQGRGIARGRRKPRRSATSRGLGRPSPAKGGASEQEVKSQVERRPADRDDHRHGLGTLGSLQEPGRRGGHGLSDRSHDPGGAHSRGAQRSGHPRAGRLDGRGHRPVRRARPGACHRSGRVLVHPPARSLPPRSRLLRV
jgi:hypothetical protein